MTQNRRVVLATARPITASRLSRKISSLPFYEVSGLAPDLSSAYVLTERFEPQLALIGSELTRLAEFEGLLSLFRVIGIPWLEIPDDVANGSGTARRFVPAEVEPAELTAWLDGAQPPRAQAPRPQNVVQDRAPAQPRSSGFLPDRMILIGASTGGIDALLTILSSFPADCPPTAIVQHTGAAFSDSLIRLFARCAAARVVPAANGITLGPGMIMVGAGSPGHLRLLPERPWRSELAPGGLVSGHLPSIDMLFRSAVPSAPSVVAALLTGMGRDGAQGLLDLRRAGAMTIAQDEATSTVYGMPRAAMELGAAVESLPLNRIAGELLSHCQKKHATAFR